MKPTTTFQRATLYVVFTGLVETVVAAGPHFAPSPASPPVVVEHHHLAETASPSISAVAHYPAPPFSVVSNTPMFSPQQLPTDVIV